MVGLGGLGVSGIYNVIELERVIRRKHAHSDRRNSGCRKGGKKRKKERKDREREKKEKKKRVARLFHLALSPRRGNGTNGSISARRWYITIRSKCTRVEAPYPHPV